MADVPYRIPNDHLSNQTLSPDTTKVCLLFVGVSKKDPELVINLAGSDIQGRANVTVLHARAAPNGLAGALVSLASQILQHSEPRSTDAPLARVLTFAVWLREHAQFWQAPNAIYILAPLALPFIRLFTNQDAMVSVPQKDRVFVAWLSTVIETNRKVDGRTREFYWNGTCLMRLPG